MIKIKGIHCTECKVVLYMQNGRSRILPYTPFPDLVYCPVCGSKAQQSTDFDEMFYLSMGYHYNLPADTMRIMFRLYMNDTSGTQRAGTPFDDWFKREIQKTIQSLASK